MEGAIMKEYIPFLHSLGPLELGYEDLTKYHDKDHWGGVALAFKIVQYAAQELNPDQAMDRSLISIRTGLNPPGLMDAFEFMTRAVTRQRIVVDPVLKDGPKSPFGSFVFEVRYGEKWIRLRLKDGILPDDFASLGNKCEAGLGSEEESKRWIGLKYGLGDQIMTHNPEDILAVVDRSA
jgi:hypothetical protein